MRKCPWCDRVMVKAAMYDPDGTVLLRVDRDGFACTSTTCVEGQGNVAPAPTPRRM